MNQQLDEIKKLADMELEKSGSMFALLAGAGEELGELSREVTIKYGDTYKQSDEGVKAEAVDLTIAALCLFFAEGGTKEELIEIMAKKNAKWLKNF